MKTPVRLVSAMRETLEPVGFAGSPSGCPFDRVGTDVIQRIDVQSSKSDQDLAFEWSILIPGLTKVLWPKFPKGERPALSGRHSHLTGRFQWDWLKFPSQSDDFVRQLGEIVLALDHLRSSADVVEYLTTDSGGRARYIWPSSEGTALEIAATAAAL